MTGYVGALSRSGFFLIANETRKPVRSSLVPRSDVQDAACAITDLAIPVFRKPT
jgi:hypothetical protein